MDDLAKDVARVDAIRNSITTAWYEVFLKSGQSIWIEAWDFSVETVIAQEEEKEGDEVVLPEVKCDQICFYDTDDNRIGGLYLPVENVEAIREWVPPEDDLEENPISDSDER